MRRLRRRHQLQLQQKALRRLRPLRLLQRHLQEQRPGFFSSRNNKPGQRRLLRHQPDPGRFRSISASTSYFTRTTTRAAARQELVRRGDGQFRITGISSSRHFWQTFDDSTRAAVRRIVKPGGFFIDSFVGSDSRKRIRFGMDLAPERNSEAASPERQYQRTIQPSAGADEHQRRITDAHDIAQ